MNENKLVMSSIWMIPSKPVTDENKTMKRERGLTFTTHKYDPN